jgi:hypothetical protein
MTHPRKRWQHEQGGNIMKKHIIYLFALLCATLAGANTAHAQVVGRIVATVPFPFTAGTAQYPAGSYTFQVVDGSNLDLMQMRTADGKTAALFEIRNAEAKYTPQSTKLVFNHVDGRYFLARMFDEGEKSGNALIDSGKKFDAKMVANQTSVPAIHSGN